MHISDWSSDVCSSDLAGTKHSPQRTGTSSSLNSNRYEAGMREAVGGQFGCAIAQIKWDMLLERHRATKAVATVRSKAEGLRTIPPYTPLRSLHERSKDKVTASAMTEWNQPPIGYTKPKTRK